MVCGQHPGLCPHDVAFALGSASTFGFALYVGRTWIKNTWTKVRGWWSRPKPDFAVRGTVCKCRSHKLTPYGVSGA
jgi:hypothetical protein